MLWFKNEQSYDSVIFFCSLVSLNFQREMQKDREIDVDFFSLENFNLVK
jgi:hypothetical protein